MAIRLQRWPNAIMPVQITIRNVPREVRDRKRAAGTRVAPEAILAETDADRR